MATRIETAPLGSPVKHGACPACHRAALRYRLETHRMTCVACPWAVTLSDDEHQDWLCVQIWDEGVIDAAGFLAEVNRRVALVPVVPEPTVISARDGEGWKLRVLPPGDETPTERAGRLADQAALNGVRVQPCNDLLTEWLASSQRRTEAGEPVCWYQVRVSAWEARCSCAATGLCAHLSAVHSALLDAQAAERDSRRTPAEVQARGKAAYSDLWGDERG